MNIQEMHIAVDQGLQKIASNKNRNFDPEEIDWCLNQSIKRFIDDHINQELEEGQGGFEFDTTNSAALDNLLTDAALPVFINSEKQRAYVTLPSELLYLVGGGVSGSVRGCDPEFAAATTLVTQTERVFVINVNKTTKSTAPFYQNLVLTFNGTPIVLQWPSSLADPDMNFVVHSVLKNSIKKIEQATGAKAYWEWYQEIYMMNSLIIVTTAATLPLILSYDGIPHTASLLKTSTVSKPGSTVSRKIAPNRWTKSSQLLKLAWSTFSKSIWQSPLATVSYGMLQVLYDNTFIVNNVSVNYIRKPQIVSLPLGFNCDINPKFHDQICDMTVEFIKMTLGDPNYQWKAGDNKTNK